MTSTDYDNFISVLRQIFDIEFFLSHSKPGTCRELMVQILGIIYYYIADQIHLSLLTAVTCFGWQTCLW